MFKIFPRNSLVNCRSAIVLSVLILFLFFSAQHFATTEITHAVADSAFCRCRSCLSSVGRLDTIVVVDHTVQNNKLNLNFEIRTENIQGLAKTKCNRV